MYSILKKDTNKICIVSFLRNTIRNNVRFTLTQTLTKPKVNEQKKELGNDFFRILYNHIQKYLVKDSKCKKGFQDRGIDY